jgi:hypothetical protein
MNQLDTIIINAKLKNVKAREEVKREVEYSKEVNEINIKF